MDKKYLLMILLLAGIFIVCSFSAYKVLKHYEGFSNDPLIYGARLRNADVCTCFTPDGKIFFFNQTAIWREGNYNPNLELNFTIGK